MKKEEIIKSDRMFESIRVKVLNLELYMKERGNIYDFIEIQLYCYL